jgi:hypothetical protein
MTEKYSARSLHQSSGENNALIMIRYSTDQFLKSLSSVSTTQAMYVQPTHVLLIQQATRRLTVICDLSGSTTFFDIISHTARFSGGGGKLWNLQQVFCSSALQHLFQTFLSVQRIQRDIVTNVETSSSKVPAVLLGF